MAQARKCDVCGGLYELYNTSYDRSRSNAIRMVKYDGEGYLNVKTYDLCPNCMKAIEDVIEERRK